MSLKNKGHNKVLAAAVGYVVGRNRAAQKTADASRKQSDKVNFENLRNSNRKDYAKTVGNIKLKQMQKANVIKNKDVNKKNLNSKKLQDRKTINDNLRHQQKIEHTQISALAKTNHFNNVKMHDQHKMIHEGQQNRNKNKIAKVRNTLAGERVKIAKKRLDMK